MIIKDISNGSTFILESNSCVINYNNNVQIEELYIKFNSKQKLVYQILDGEIQRNRDNLILIKQSDIINFSKNKITTDKEYKTIISKYIAENAFEFKNFHNIQDLIANLNDDKGIRLLEEQFSIGLENKISIHSVPYNYIDYITSLDISHIGENDKELLLYNLLLSTTDNHNIIILVDTILDKFLINWKNTLQNKFSIDLCIYESAQIDHYPDDLELFIFKETNVDTVELDKKEIQILVYALNKYTLKNLDLQSEKIKKYSNYYLNYHNSLKIENFNNL